MPPTRALRRPMSCLPKKNLLLLPNLSLLFWSAAPSFESSLSLTPLCRSPLVLDCLPHPTCAHLSSRPIPLPTMLHHDLTSSPSFSYFHTGTTLNL
ncbi:hypothetical protein BGW80DRAFT_1378923 [Lactifluus volemus]|nr:hypothetical protein BGW80DRAFT_1378923 [Lactifluus volemus]